MPEDKHNKIIAEQAREALSPIGCRQKGRSRVWIGDHHWWVDLVEFQPSSWPKGSCLNVAACWLWDGKDYFSFDVSHRVSGHVQFVDPKLFETEMRVMANQARAEVLTLRNRFHSLAAVAHWLDSQPDDGGWKSFHAGISNGLVGNVDGARTRFLRVASQVWDGQSKYISRATNGEEIERVLYIDEPHWRLDLKSRAQELAELVADREAFLAEVTANIQKTRAAVKLPNVDVAQRLADENVSNRPSGHAKMIRSLER